MSTKPDLERQIFALERAVELLQKRFAAALAECEKLKASRNARDTARIDWLADIDNDIGFVSLPTKCVESNLRALRDAIDMAMAQGAQ